MSRAFRNVLHLLTRQQWPPSSFCREERAVSQPSSRTTSDQQLFETTFHANCTFVRANKDQPRISARPACKEVGQLLVLRWRFGAPGDDSRCGVQINCKAGRNPFCCKSPQIEAERLHSKDILIVSFSKASVVCTQPK